MNNIFSTNLIPDATALEAISRLTNKTHALTVARLEDYGNHITQAHSDALHMLAKEFSLLTFGLKRGRFAYPLPTGMGKTQTVVGFCTALITEGCQDKSVVVSATKVEALAGIKRDLIANGVPDECIGLIHSYRYDQEIHRDALPEGFASLPSTDENDDRQIMLVTHNRIKGGKLERFNCYKGQPRNLVIWDESLIASKSRLISLLSLKKSLGHLQPDLTDYSSARLFFNAVVAGIEQELMRQRSGVEAQRLELPEIDDNHLHAILCDVGTAEVQEPLRQFIKMLREPLRVIAGEQGQAVVAYDLVVPKELESVAVLDASYPIRELEKMDKTITLGCNFSPDLKRFDLVRLHHLKAPSGRGSVTNSFNNSNRTDRKISMEVCDLIAKLPTDEGVIIFTFKTRATGGCRKSTPDFNNILKADLMDFGVDVNNKLPQGDRIVMLTWGQETSLSTYSYCKHVVFAGVLHRDHLQIASEMIGQTDNLYRAVPRSAVTEVVNSEIAHCLYQAMSRGSCRMVDGSQALPMDVWLIHGNDHIRPILEISMPGLTWETWEAKYLVAKLKLEAAITAIQEYLETLSNSIDVIAIQILRKAVNADASRNYFSKALKIAVANHGEWEIVGRRITRLEPDFFDVFSEST